jgi:hypothetical protein
MRDGPFLRLALFKLHAGRALIVAAPGVSVAGGTLFAAVVAQACGSESYTTRGVVHSWF